MSHPNPEQWKKTGGWHCRERYEPTAQDRRIYSRSYPDGNPGPFYVWADCGPSGHDTRQEADAHTKALADRDE